MMLPAKSSKRTKLGLYSVLCILSAIAVMSAGCKPKEEPVDPQKALYGEVARPTWTVQEDYDYSSSMTAVIKIETLNGQIVNEQMVNDSDLLAAFVGEECRGIATYDGGLFYLFIAGPNEQSSITNDQLTIKYWSAHYTNLFVSDPITFVNDAQLGSTAEPYKPALVVR